MPEPAAPRLKQVTLVITEQCNHRCDYCYVPVARGRSMSAATARRAVDLLFDHAPRVGTAAISFFGGEPFLAPALMETVVDAALARRRLGQRVAFGTPTNGTLLDAAALALAARCGMELVVSIDGTGSQRHLTSGAPTDEEVRFVLRRLAARPGLKLTARLTVTPANVGRLRANVESIFALGVGRIVYLPAFEAGWDAAALEAWADQHAALGQWLLGLARAGRPAPELPSWRGILARFEGAPRRHCGAGAWQVAVDPDGAIYPCYRAIYDPQAAAAHLGHVEAGFTRPEVRARWAGLDPLAPSTLDGSCAECEAAGGCTFFCPSLGLLLGGDPGTVPAVACRLTRGQVAAVRDFGVELERQAARRGRGRGMVAASALLLAMATSTAACGDRSTTSGGVCPVPSDGGVSDARLDGQADAVVGGVCPVWADAGEQEDAMVGGVCPVVVDAGEQEDAMVGGVCPVVVDAGEPDDAMTGGICPVGGIC